MITRILTFSLLTTLFAAKVAAAEDKGAEALHDQHCMSCHGTEVYTREDRMVGSLPALESQVRRCESNLGLRWFDDEITEMTGFLNDRFYQFKP